MSNTCCKYCKITVKGLYINCPKCGKNLMHNNEPSIPPEEYELAEGFDLYHCSRCDQMTINEDGICQKCRTPNKYLGDVDNSLDKQIEEWGVKHLSGRFMFEPMWLDAKEELKQQIEALITEARIDEHSHTKWLPDEAKWIELEADRINQLKENK